MSHTQAPARTELAGATEGAPLVLGTLIVTCG